MKFVTLSYLLRQGRLRLEAQGDWAPGAGLRLGLRLPRVQDGAVELALPFFGQGARELSGDSVALAAVLLLAEGLPVAHKASVRFLFPVSEALLAELRRSRAWPGLQWAASAEGPPHAALLAALRELGLGARLAEQLGLSAPPLRLALFGTSRLQRAFARREADGSVRRIGRPGCEPLFARMGFFHGLREVQQAIDLLQRRVQPPPGWLGFAFRVENPFTTPDNAFDPTLLAALRAASGFAHGEPAWLDAASAVAIEVSTLRAFVHLASGTVLHANPNLLHDVPYGALYPQPYYARFLPDAGVVEQRDSDAELTERLAALRTQLAPRPLLVFGHLAPRQGDHAHRRAQNARLAQACAAAGVVYVDTAPFVEQHGFARSGEAVDPHHLAPAGEDAFGAHLLQRAAECLQQAASTQSPAAPGRRPAAVRVPACLDRQAPLPPRSAGAPLAWASLGENCLPDGILQRHGLKSGSTLFSHGRSNIDYALQLLHNRYEGLLDRAQLQSVQLDGKTGARHLAYRACEPGFDPSVSAGFEFTHHDVVGDEAARESMERKRDTLHRLAEQGDLILLYHHRSNPDTDLPRLVDKLERYARKVAVAPYRCRIFLLRQRLVEPGEARRIDRGRASEHVDDFLLHVGALWGGQDPADFWAQRDDDLLAEMFQVGRSWGAP